MRRRPDHPSTRRWLRRWLPFGATWAAAAAAGLLVTGSPLLQPVEGWTIDARFAIRGNRPPPPGVVVVGLDAASLRGVGEYPIPRAIEAQVIRRVTRAGARVVVWDFALRLASQPADDRRFISALEAARPSVVAVTTVGPAGEVEPLAGRLPFPAAAVPVYRLGPSGKPRPVQGSVPLVPVERIAPGYAYLRTDRDGTIRAMPGGVRGIDALSVAAAQAAWAAAHGGPARSVPLPAIPASALIDFAGPPGTIPEVPLWSVLRGVVDPQAFRGKVVVIGPTADSVHDRHAVSTGAAMSGPEIQASAIATALAGSPLRRTAAGPSRWMIIGAGLMVPLPLVPHAAAARRRRRRRLRLATTDAAAAAAAALGDEYPPPLSGLVVGAAALAVWLAGTQALFDAGHVLPVVPGVVAITVATLVSWILAGVVERREGRRLRTVFAAHGALGAGTAGWSAGGSAADARGTSASLLWPVEVIAGFRIDSELGRGGVGVVYRATQLGLGRAVALKLLHPEFAADPVHRERFVREAQAAARIDHPGVIPIIRAGDDDGLLYIAMQLVDGGDLAGRLATGGPLAPLEAAALVERVAAAIDAAHGAGVVHGDVKPSNLLLPAGRAAHAFLTDFGSATLVGPGARGGGIGPGQAPGAAPAGAWVGTPAYLAPEQAAGAAPTGAVDIYALAAVLVHCLTGHPPFVDDDPRLVVLAHRTAERPRITEIADGLPAELDAVIARAMAIDPRQRPSSAALFAREVAAALDPVTTRAHPAHGPG